MDSNNTDLEIIRLKKGKVFFLNLLLFTICLFSPFIHYGQSNDESLWKERAFGLDATLDVFPLTACLGVSWPITQSIAVGISGEAGVNFSNLILMAGERVGKSNTPFLYEPMDMYDSGRYSSLYGGSLFFRFFNDKKIPLELGLQREFFFHSVVTPNEDDINIGFYTGPYVKIFIPTGFREEKMGSRRKMSVGMEATYGNLNFARFRAPDELAVMVQFWMRFDLNYN